MSITGCSQSQDDKWSTLSQDQFEIKYPSNWELSDEVQLGLSFALLSPTSNEEDDFRENVNLLVQDLTEYDLNLQQYVEISEGQIKTLITDGNILSSDVKNNAQGEYQRVLFTGKQGILNLKFEQLYWVQDNTAYVLTLTCKEDEFSNYQELGEKILSTFKIK